MFDSGEDEEGKFFVVLELMKHDLIREREENGQAFAGWDDFAALVALPLLQALAYAHAMDIAHRDVKPANVLVSYLCPCQLAGRDFVPLVRRDGSHGTGRFSFAHRSMAA